MSSMNSANSWGKGYKVIALDRDDGDKIKGLGCERMQVDVSSPDSIRAFKQKHSANDEPIDLLLNIAGATAWVWQYFFFWNADFVQG